jgi:hypothetical protein
MALEHWDDQVTDLVLFLVANAVNLLLTGMFLARVKGLGRLAKGLGLLAVCLAVPVAAVGVLNLLGGREWWTVILPALYVLYALLHLTLDYILKLDFRGSHLLGPYLALYYLGLLGLVGYSFSMGKGYGFVTLGTYFVCLFSTWYAYSRVGHGVASRKQAEDSS